MKPSQNICLLLLPVVVMFVLTGCGYSTGDMHRPGIKTIAVPIFTRGPSVYRRSIEMRLTEAVVKHIEAHTRYKVTTRARADTELIGRLEEISQRILNRNPNTGRPREMEITFTISLTWMDLNSGKPILKRSNLRSSGTYIPPGPFSEDFFEGSEDVVNRAARRIVEQLEAEWPAADRRDSLRPEAHQPSQS